MKRECLPSLDPKVQPPDRTYEECSNACSILHEMNVRRNRQAETAAWPVAARGWLPPTTRDFRSPRDPDWTTVPGKLRDAGTPH